MSASGDYPLVSNLKAFVRQDGAGDPRRDPSFDVRRKRNVEGKQVIGQLLAEVIPDHTTLFIGGGTTLEIAGQHLVRREGIFALTTNLHVALSMQQCKNSTIIVPHGELQFSNHSLVGSTILESVARYAMDICLISTAAINAAGDFFEFDNAIAVNIEAMKKSARHIVLAADSSKFLKNGIVKVGNLAELATFVTDVCPAPHVCDILKQAGVRLVCP